MGMSFPDNGLESVKTRLAEFFDGFAEDLELVGEAGARAVVQTTLAGIGEDDKPFEPYSAAYQATLDAVGGKARQTVDLRGIFYHDGQKHKHYRSEKRRQAERAGRRAYVGVAFVHRAKDGTLGGIRVFQGATKTTRPQVGLTDPRSEMSLDLIKIHATDDRLTLQYVPRSEDYMVTHQRGDGTAPARVWFSAKKAAVWEAMVGVFARAVAARVQRFNDGGTGRP